METNSSRHRCEFLPLEQPAGQQRQDRRAAPLYIGIVWAVLLALLVGSSAAPVVAEEASKDKQQKQQMKSLDEQVQEIKSDVLGIAAELSRLEERLIYPSNTQVAVFVSLAGGDDSRLDSVGIQIDGESVAHHVYSFKELEALKKGGVQRIYTGNVATGEHRLDVAIAGKLPSGSDFRGNETFSITKDVGPKLVGLRLATKATGGASIELGGW